MHQTTEASELPRRAGEPPQTSRPSPERRTPHSQLSQNAPPELQEELFSRARALPGVEVGPSLVSVPGARGFHLVEHVASGPPEAFQAGREFAHIHPAGDGSLHLTLPRPLADRVFEKGWGEPHPVSGTPMVYGPRDPEELEVVWGLVRASYEFATGPQGGGALRG